jgi:predicted secreted Zn-dependent protease
MRVTEMPVDFVDTERASSDVHGGSLAAVASVISQLDEAGKTEWSPTYVMTDGNPPDVTVTVKTKITMPRWPEYGTACQAEKDEWDRFFAALEAHEQGHVDLVRQHLGGIDEQMAGQSSDGAKQLWVSALQDLQSASDNYDVDTDHGRNQGTVIDVSVGTQAPSS